MADWNFGASAIWDGLENILSGAERIGQRILDWDINRLNHDLHKDQLRAGIAGGVPNYGTPSEIATPKSSAGWSNPNGMNWQKWGVVIAGAGLVLTFLMWRGR